MCHIIMSNLLSIFFNDLLFIRLLIHLIIRSFIHTFGIPDITKILHLKRGSQSLFSLTFSLPVISASLRVMDIVMNSRKASVAIFSQ